jgi:hypothetical protein
MRDIVHEIHAWLGRGLIMNVLDWIRDNGGKLCTTCLNDDMIVIDRCKGVTECPTCKSREMFREE